MKKRESISKIKLSDVQKEKLNAEIKAFYIAERGEEIGMIVLIQLLDLFEKKWRRLSIIKPMMTQKNGLLKCWIT